MVYVLLGKGFEEVEALAPVDILRRGGINVTTCGIGGREVVGSHGIPVMADILVEELNPEQADMIVLPGGLGGVASIRGSEKALSAISAVHARGGFVAAICAAPTILAELNITDGKKATCYPGMEDQMGNAHMENAAVTTDGKIICGRAAGSAMAFGLALLRALGGKEKAETVRNAMVAQEEV